jgi:hypothetical protein
MKLQPGEHVERGQPVFRLVESGALWIEANFKETQLAGMREGQGAQARRDDGERRGRHRPRARRAGRGARSVRGSERRPVRASASGAIAVPARHPALCSASVILATVPYSMDWTLAAVALPHMRGAFSATRCPRWC